MKLTICGGIVELTNFKESCLDFEYNGFQKYMQFGIDDGIYSSYKANKGWKFRKIKYREYPLPLWQKLTKIEFKLGNKISPYWIRIRTKRKRGGIWIAFHTKQTIPENAKLLDSFMIQRNNKYELRLHFELPDIPKINTSNILAIDIGERVMATACGSNGFKIMYGREIRGIRRHYSYLKKTLGRKKLIDKIKSIGSKERNVINGILHRISKQIISDAVAMNGAIVLGNLKGLPTSSKNKERRIRRIVHNFPYWKFINYITYKAKMTGIPVVKVNERNTSKICHRCHTIGKRISQGLFVCSSCHLEYNADYNSAHNIMQRLPEQCFGNGAVGLKPENPSHFVNG